MQRPRPEAGAQNELFTEGNVSTGVRATTVEARYLNAITLELVNLIESQGITLSPDNNSQVLAAIQSIAGFGGDTQTSQEITNNVGPVDLEGILFNKTDIKAAEISLDIYRRTDTFDLHETGKLYVTYHAGDDDWKITTSTFGQDAGVVFKIEANGQVQYTSNDLEGDNYEGTIRIAQVLRYKT